MTERKTATITKFTIDAEYPWRDPVQVTWRARYAEFPGKRGGSTVWIPADLWTNHQDGMEQSLRKHAQECGDAMLNGEEPPTFEIIG